MDRVSGYSQCSRTVQSSIVACPGPHPGTLEDFSRDGTGSVFVSSVLFRLERRRNGQGKGESKTVRESKKGTGLTRMRKVKFDRVNPKVDEGNPSRPSEEGVRKGHRRFRPRSLNRSRFSCTDRSRNGGWAQSQP